MEGLLTFLLFGAFFYFMMRFGCGAHAVHGHHGGHGQHTGHGPSTEHNMKAAKDPVCGMEVGPDEGYARIYEGRQYRFCSRNCLDKFDLSPGQYVTGSEVAR